MRKVLLFLVVGLLVTTQAMAALTVTITERWSEGKHRAVYGSIAFDASYPTGGEVLSAGNIGLKSLDILDISNNELGYLFEYDKTNGKVIIYTAQGVELANATDLSVTLADVEFTAIGR